MCSPKEMVPKLTYASAFPSNAIDRPEIDVPLPAVTTHFVLLLPVFKRFTVDRSVPLVMLPYILGWNKWSSPKRHVSD